MSDGSTIGITADRAIETILGGAEQPTDEEKATPEQARARVESTPLPWEDDFSEIKDSYGGSTDSIAHLFLILAEDDPSVFEPRFFPEDFEFEWMQGKEQGLDNVLWEEMKARWGRKVDPLTSAATGFMVSFATNTVLYILDKPVGDNSAIIEF